MLFKRKGSKYWHYKFTISGKTVFRSTGTEDKIKAQEIADKAKADTWDVVKGGQRERHLWQEAVVRYLQESAHKKSLETDKIHLRWLKPYLDGVYVDQIDGQMIEKLIQQKLKVAGNARVNRMTALLSAILRKACKQWDWIDKSPYIRRFKETGQRLRWLTHDEAIRLLDALPSLAILPTWRHLRWQLVCVRRMWLA